MTSLDDLKAADLMTSPILTMKSTCTLREAAKLLSEREVSGALVTDRHGKPVGVLSLFDIVARLSGLRMPAAPAGEFYEATGSNSLGDVESGAAILDALTATDLMTPEILSVPHNASLYDVATKMSDLRIHRIFVTDLAGPVGIISAMDIVHALARVGRRSAGTP